MWLRSCVINSTRIWWLCCTTTLIGRVEDKLLTLSRCCCDEISRHRVCLIHIMIIRFLLEVSDGGLELDSSIHQLVGTSPSHSAIFH